MEDKMSIYWNWKDFNIFVTVFCTGSTWISVVYKEKMDLIILEKLALCSISTFLDTNETGKIWS